MLSQKEYGSYKQNKKAFIRTKTLTLLAAIKKGNLVLANKILDNGFYDLNYLHPFRNSGSMVPYDGESLNYEKVKHNPDYHIEKNHPEYKFGQKTRTVLMHAIEHFKFGLVQKIIKNKNCDLNVMDHNGYTALTHSLKHGLNIADDLFDEYLKRKDLSFLEDDKYKKYISCYSSINQTIVKIQKVYQVEISNSINMDNNIYGDKNVILIICHYLI
ncbi:MAG: hypothetical protein Edafosvirus1_58 [Edafosvirus sp.]|uniref:Ankyrin repeat protein n=1 Tax=Edafosvirus sp. TaxID=2487765 RepID=A0A3G4ZS50_9VIRU|nr:MAG: hypothetical protein Edafosvirus1_58 [Edafosvirus sp.]